MSEIVREGGCGCGHVRYRVADEPIFVNNCHCRQCQQQTGGTSVVNAFFEADNFELTSGELTRHSLKGGSGGPHVISRCSQCGVAIFSEYARFGSLGVGIRAGTLDQPGSVSPSAVVFAAERMPWVALPEGIPQFEGYYNPFELLQGSSLARFNALLRRRDAGEG